MARASIAAKPLSCNEISLLAQLFERSFDYHLDHPSAFFTDYLQSLRTLAGLGFTAVLADGDLFSAYQISLNRFLESNHGDFKENPGNKTNIAQTSSQMVANAIICFMALGFPRYYEDFVTALRYCIAKIPSVTDPLQNDAEEILKRLTIVG